MLFRHESKFLKIMLFLILLFFVVLILKPIINVLLSSILIAFVLHPLYDRLIKWKVKREIAAILVITLFLLIFLIPAFFIGRMIIRQIFSLDYSAISVENLRSMCESFPLCARAFGDATTSHLFSQSINGLVAKLLISLSDFAYSFIRSLPSLLFDFLLMIIFTYLFLIEGKRYIQSIYHYLPLDKNELSHLINKTNDVMKGVVFGAIAGAAVQGLCSSIIYFLLGFNVFLLLGFLTFLGAFVPVVGTSIVWIPVSVYLILKGIYLAETIFIVKGIILLIVGALLLTTIDDIIRPLLVSYETKLNPIIVLAGIIGGLKLIGFLGLFYGPLVLELFITFLKDEKQSL